MIDLARVDPHLCDAISLVVQELASTVQLDPANVLVVGANCRDILHAGFGHAFPLRATTDTDLGIAVSDWTISHRIDAHYRHAGSNGIRYRIAGIAVDIMPFGEVEDPAGISHPARRGEDLVVFGFRDVYARALPLRLPDGMAVRLPHPAGYAALKMRSWIDRSVQGNDKDAKDLALASFWYQESEAIADRLYGIDEEFQLLSDLGMDIGLAATRLLAMDASAQLSPENAADLASRWRHTNHAAFARDFLLPTAGPRIDSLARRQQLSAQFQL